MRTLRLMLLVGLLAPASSHSQSWFGSEAERPRPPPAPEVAPPPPPAEAVAPAPRDADEPVLVSLGEVRGDGATALEVISTNGRTRARLMGLNGGLKVWRTMSGHEPRRLFAGLERVTALALDRTGERLAAGDAAGRIRVWDWQKSREPISRSQRDRPVYALTFYAGKADRLLVTEGDEAGGTTRAFLELP